jgi:hypothetical protein
LWQPSGTDKESLVKMNQQLAENNYLLIPGFIDSTRANLLADQFRQFCRENNIGGDHQVEQSQAYYNFKPLLKLVCEKLQQVSEIAQEELLPICSYSRVYRQGNVLKRHRDRPGCEFSLTVNLYQDHPWSIGIQKPTGEDVMVDLNPGDAVMYLGKNADHWRDSFGGQEYIQVFLHYVNSKGPYSSEHREFINYINHHFL